MVLDKVSIKPFQRFMVCLGKTTFSDSTSLLFCVEGYREPRKKAIALLFSHILDKDMGCFDYAEHEDSANST